MSNDPAATARRHWPSLSLPQLGGILLLVLFLALLAWTGELESFFRPGSLKVLLQANTAQGVAALGMLLIIISGGIDLSVGSVVALVAVVVVQVYRLAHEQWVDGSVSLASLVALGAGLATGLLCGLGNGLAVTRLRVPAFVATLGMMSIARGLTIWLSGKTRVHFPQPEPPWVVALARVDSPVVYFNPGVWLLVLLAVFMFVLLRFTVFGRYCYAIGSNEATARLCGVHVERTKLGIYLLAGVFAFVAGVLTVAKGSGGGPDTGQGLELEVIAAVVIGGASLAGGEGTVGGTLLGVLVLGVLEHGLTLLSVPLELKYIVIGGVVVAKMALTEWQRRRGESW
jgi:ribose transport system permease protein